MGFYVWMNLNGLSVKLFEDVLYIVHLVNLFSSVNVKVHEVHSEDNHSEFMAQLVGVSPSDHHRFEPRVVYLTPCTLYLYCIGLLYSFFAYWYSAQVIDSWRWTYYGCLQLF